MKNKFLTILFPLILLSCNGTESARSIKLGHGLDTSHPVHKAMVFMAEELSRNSKGALTMEIYPNQQLGSERQCLELLQIGSLGMTKVSAAVMENFSPEMRVLGLPYLFRDREHTFKVLDGPIGKELLDGAKKYWLKGLGYYDAGSRSFYTKKEPVMVPEDLTGQKIRVMESITAMDMVRNLSGSPTPISAGELYTALQQGVVDGAENNPPTFYSSRHYEVCKYYSLDEHATIPDVMLISTHLWDTLNHQQQSWLQAAMDSSIVYQRKLWAETEKKALEEVKKAGVTISYPDKTEFKKKVAPIYHFYKNDGTIGKLIDRIQSVQ